GADPAARIAGTGVHGAHPRRIGVPMRVTLARVIRAEWTKLRALRSTWIVLAGTALLVVGLAAAAGWAQHRDVGTGGTPPTTAEAVGAALLGIDLLALGLGVVGGRT